jgi:hypothetical protein
MSTQPTHHFLTLLPSNHATFSAATVAPDTIPDNSDPNPFLTNDMGAQHKTRRSSSSATTSSTVSDKAVAPAEPVVATKRASTFLSN